MAWLSTLIYLGISIAFLVLFYRMVVAIEKIANK
ncbi:MAG: hypothetical protein BWX89_00583 [candidate division TA06 bacterium ADurb.Bin131]|jgi:hypothetical protein|uniref:Uncharacterized protein n=1 Tax=candidate division TA06 bacterium ADurb.Bin131 TaxID=1852827 RepID=A0A1V6CBP7_UNCT6|nr:MAG: hypothetical protein BWX89_00583 [candidate division TA06 bacterium ADurb.Bin131]